MKKDVIIKCKRVSYGYYFYVENINIKANYQEGRTINVFSQRYSGESRIWSFKEGRYKETNITLDTITLNVLSTMQQVMIHYLLSSEFLDYNFIFDERIEFCSSEGIK